MTGVTIDVSTLEYTPAAVITLAPPPPMPPPLQPPDNDDDELLPVYIAVPIGTVILIVLGVMVYFCRAKKKSNSESTSQVTSTKV